MKTSDLKTALEAVKPGLGQKEVCEQATSFAFLPGEVVTFNDEIAVRYPIGLQITGAVRANELYKLISKIKDEEIELEATENELLISGKRAKAGLKLEAEIKLPLEELTELDGKWRKLPETFLPSVKMAFPFAAKDMSKPILSCVNIKGQMVEATDDFRIIQIDMGVAAKKAFREALQIPATAAKQLIRYSVKEFCCSPGWGHFRADSGAVFSCRVMAEDFPDPSPFFDVEGVELKLPKTMKELLEKAGVFSAAQSDSDEEVKITVENKKLTIRSEGESGWFEETVNCAFSGDPISFSVSPAMLKDILDHLQHCTVGDNSMLFVGDNFKYVVCLIGE